MHFLLECRVKAEKITLLKKQPELFKTDESEHQLNAKSNKKVSYKLKLANWQLAAKVPKGKFKTKTSKWQLEKTKSSKGQLNVTKGNLKGQSSKLNAKSTNQL